MNQLKALLASSPNQHIGVIGDFALDAYWHVNPADGTTSLETGKRTQPVTRQYYAGGAAANVAMNLVALGVGRVSAFGVVGPDPFGAELRRLLDRSGIELAGLLCQEQDWDTAAYIKPYRGAEEMQRWDCGDFNALSEETADQLLEQLNQQWAQLDALIINAQSRTSIHNRRVKEMLTTLLGRSDAPVTIADVRDPAHRYRDCAFKVNEYEAVRLCGLAAESKTGPSLEQVRLAASTLYAEQQKPVFITRGAKGMVVGEYKGVREVPAVDLGDCAVDVSGAGDAALAGITVALVCGAPVMAAAQLGTYTAAIALQKLCQTGQATPPELIALLQSLAEQDSGG